MREWESVRKKEKKKRKLIKIRNKNKSEIVCCLPADTLWSNQDFILSKHVHSSFAFKS